MTLISNGNLNISEPEGCNIAVDGLIELKWN